MVREGNDVFTSLRDIPLENLPVSPSFLFGMEYQGNMSGARYYRAKPPTDPFRRGCCAWRNPGLAEKYAVTPVVPEVGFSVDNRSQSTNLDSVCDESLASEGLRDNVLTSDPHKCRLEPGGFSGVN